MGSLRRPVPDPDQFPGTPSPQRCSPSVWELGTGSPELVGTGGNSQRNVQKPPEGGRRGRSRHSIEILFLAPLGMHPNARLQASEITELAKPIYCGSNGRAAA